MADYNKQTVAQLRQLLKDRGISSTGLQRKAQIVRKLEEADNNKEDAPESDGAQDAPVDDAPPDAIEEVAQAEEDGSAAEQLQVPGPEPSQAGGK